MLDSQQTGRRHVQQPMSKGAKPAGYWFKQRDYTDPSFDRRLATTTGEMLNQISDTKNKLTSTASFNSNRRHPNISNRISEHDNRNSIQNYGEYFGRGFGKRFVSSSTVYNHNWIFSNDPRPKHPDHSITQRDYRGWPPIDNPRSLTNINKKSSSNWMTSCYDNYGGDSEHTPNELLYRDDYKRIPIHPWHY